MKKSFVMLIIVVLMILIGCSNSKNQSESLIYLVNGEKLFELASNPIQEGGETFYYWIFYKPEDIKGNTFGIVISCLDCKEDTFTHSYYNFPRYHAEKISLDKPFKIKTDGPNLFKGMNKIEVWIDNGSKKPYGTLIVNSENVGKKPLDEDEFVLEDDASATIEDDASATAEDDTSSTIEEDDQGDLLSSETDGNTLAENLTIIPFEKIPSYYDPLAIITDINKFKKNASQGILTEYIPFKVGDDFNKVLQEWGEPLGGTYIGDGLYYVYGHCLFLVKENEYKEKIDCITIKGSGETKQSIIDKLGEPIDSGWGMDGWYMSYKFGDYEVVFDFDDEHDDSLLQTMTIMESIDY